VISNIILKKRTLFEIASFGCVLHCLFVPIIVLFIPFLGSFLQNIFFELLIFSTSIVCGIAIIYSGYCQHKRRHVFALFLLGVIFWLAHLLFEIFEFLEVGLSLLLIGSLFVLISYYFNFQYLKRCSNEDSCT